MYWNTYKIGGDTIDRIMILEVNGKSSKIFDEILTVVQKHSEIQRYDFKAQTSLILNGLKIDYDSRKVFCNGQEVVLTVKEYEMLCLLTAYRGRVLEYGQIYQKAGGLYSGKQQVQQTPLVGAFQEGEGVCGRP